MLKSENISNVCPTELIDRLVIVTDYAEILIFGSQQTYKFKLCGIGILILIHHDVFETFLIILKNISAILEKFYSLYDQIIEIQRVIFPQ